MKDRHHQMSIFKIYLVILAVLASVFGLIHVTNLTIDNPINSDGYGYYAYLPALIIDGNLKISDPPKYDPTFQSLTHPSMTKIPGKDSYLIKYPPGVAIMTAPFFALALLLAIVTGISPTGYEPVFQIIVGLGASVYASLGLLLCFKYYSKEVSLKAALLSLGLIIVSTNLLTYTGYSPLMSHAYALFLVASIMTLTKSWWKNPRIKSSLLLGVTMSLLVMVRSVHVIMFLFIFLHSVRPSSRINLIFTKKRALQLGIIMAMFVIGLLPQLIYHHSLTGEWWYFGYQGEGFNWLEPAWYGVLLSPRSGVLFWSPVWWLALIGIWKSWGKPWWWAVAVVMCLQVYIIASWGQWWYGDSYGHRAFIDLYPLMGLWLAFAIDWLMQRSWLKISATIIVSLTLVINQFLMYSWWVGDLPRDHTTIESIKHTLFHY